MLNGQMGIECAFGLLWKVKKLKIMLEMPTIGLKEPVETGFTLCYFGNHRMQRQYQ